MATIKSYTDIEQSKKLAEILPIESADYTRLGKNEDNVLTRPYLESYSSELKGWIGKDEIYPCWSLAALIEVLPLIEGFKPVIDLDINQIRYEGKYRDELIVSSENLVDACYEMIIKLHELNLL